MGFNIWPTDNDVGTVSQVGGVGSEQGFRRAHLGLSGYRTAYKISGLTCTDGGSGEIDIAAGTSYVNGLIVEIDAVVAHVATASLTDNYLWLRVDKTADLATGYTLVETASITPIDDDHLLLCRFSTNATPIITSIDEAQVLHRPGYICGKYTGDNAAARTISLGFTPRLVHLRDPAADPTSFSMSVLLPDYDDPADYTSEGSLTWDNVASATFKTADEDRPVIVEGGFRVGWVTGPNGLNTTGLDYVYFAWA